MTDRRGAVIAVLLIVFSMTAAAARAASGGDPAEASGQAAAAAQKIEAQVPLREGMRIVAGRVTRAASPVARATVQVTVRESAVAARRRGRDVGYYAQKAQGITDQAGMFTVALAQPLVGMQRVEICVGTAPPTCSPQIDVSEANSWGRVRAYFAGGVELSKEHGDFSKQDLVVSFSLDNMWWQTSDVNQSGVSRSIHTFLDTRLTAVPVAVTAPASESNGTTPAGTLDTFIQSQKAAIVQVGVYLPIYGEAMVWTHEFKTNALFVAPVLKAGLATTAAPATTTTTNGSTTTTTTPTTTDVFRSYSAGVGIGHYRLSESSNSAPELISYLHVTVGKWENFELDHWRVALEGRLKIPDMPLQIGFDANVRLRGSGPGDLRFLFGTRFDLGDLIGKLKSFSAS